MDAAFEAVLRHEDEVAGQLPLPENWCWTQLGEVLPIAYGKALPERERTSGQFAVFGSSGRVGLHDQHIAPANSIMVGRKGSAGSVFYSEKPSWPIDTAYFTSGSDAIDIRYGYWFLWFRKLGRLDQSTAIPSLSRDIYNVQPIPLAPLSEQRRIVERVDALFAEIDEGEMALAAARKGLDTFRRALLKAAVTGELTKDWRAANTVSENGHDLLARVAKDRANRGERARRITDSAPLDSSILPQLPSDWGWATLGEIVASIRNGTSAAPRAASNQHEILRISAVRSLRIDEAQIRFLDDDQAKAAASATVEAGDLLFTRYNGSADLVGVGAIYRGPKRFYPDKIIRARLEPVLLEPIQKVWIQEQ
jgi:type I restriction enzyme, S subunit